MRGEDYKNQVQNIIIGGTELSVVIKSVDYTSCLDRHMAALAKEKIEKGKDFSVVKVLKQNLVITVKEIINS